MKRFVWKAVILGLVTPQEICHLKEQMTKAGNIVTETVDLDRLYQIAQGEQKANSPEKGRSSRICETGRAGSRFNAIWKSIKAQTTARFGSG